MCLLEVGRNEQGVGFMMKSIIINLVGIVVLSVIQQIFEDVLKKHYGVFLVSNGWWGKFFYRSIWVVTGAIIYNLPKIF